MKPSRLSPPLIGREVFSFTRSSDLYSSPHPPSECRGVAALCLGVTLTIVCSYSVLLLDTGDSFIKEARSWLSLQALEPSSSLHNTYFCFGYEPAPRGELGLFI
jgi:hypothetical protein